MATRGMDFSKPLRTALLSSKTPPKYLIRTFSFGEALSHYYGRGPRRPITLFALWHRMQKEAVALPYYLLLSRSITHAQRMSRVLERAGITARFFRPPMGLTDRGCSYAVRIGEGTLPEALERLRAENLLPMRIFYSAGGDGAFREIMM